MSKNKLSKKTKLIFWMITVRQLFSMTF